MKRPVVRRTAPDSFARGASILAFAALVSRVLGAVYRIPLARLLGEEGIGLFQLAYPLYFTLVMISTAGFPVAISKMVAEREALRDRHGSLRILRVSITILSITGLACGAGLMLAARWLAANMYHEPRAAASLAVLGPAVFLLSVSSCLRGFFQGLRRMAPSGLSQVFEQITRASAMVIAAVLFSGSTLALAVSRVTLGASLGAAVGLAVLTWSFVSWRLSEGSGVAPTHKGQGTGEILATLVMTALPIALGALVIPLSQLLDSLIVPARLMASGVARSAAVAHYGQLTGMALVMAYFPTIVTQALAASLVPAISAGIVKGDARTVGEHTDFALKVTLSIGIPAAAGLYLFGPVITGVLFGSEAAGVLLRILSLGTLFLCLQQTCSGILQGAGRVGLPVRNLALGSLLKLALTLLLVPTALGVRGAAYASVAGFAFSAILSLRDVGRVATLGVSALQSLAKPLFGAACMIPGAGMVLRGAYSVTGSLGLSLGAGVVSGVAVYLVALMLVGGINSQDLERVRKR